MLNRPNLRVQRAAFDRVLSEARAGDFAYFVPPYAPLSKTSNFRGYTGRGFSDADQERLQQVLIELARRGPSVMRLYEDNAEARAAGLGAWQFPARRAVNSRAERRSTVAELVVSNIRPRHGA